MCQVVQIGDQEPIETQAAFTALVGAACLVWAYEPHQDNPGACLCPLDIEASLSLAGYAEVDYDPAAGVYHVKQIQA